MEHGFFHHTTVAQMLDDDSLEQRGCYTAVPDTLRVHDDDGPAGTHAETRCFPSFDASGAEQEILALEERREKTVQRTAASVWGAEAAGADDDVPAVSLHARHCRSFTGHHAKHCV